MLEGVLEDVLDDPTYLSTDVPCRECPWRRSSPPGWLGGFTAIDWVNLAHSDELVACHLTVEQEGVWTSSTRQCRGAAIYRANVAKIPRYGWVDYGPVDRLAVFGSPVEFLEHHERTRDGHDECDGPISADTRDQRLTGRDTAYRAAELSFDQLKWISSLVRMQIRKIERDLAGIAPHPGQSPEEFEAFRQSLQRKIRFAEHTLAALVALREQARTGAST